MKNTFRSARAISAAALFGVFAFGMAGCVVTSGCGVAWQPANFKGATSATAAAVANTGLEVTNANGAITVEAGDVTEVQVSGEVRSISQERLAMIKLLAERQTDGSLKVSVQWPPDGRKGSEGCDIKIVTPQVSWAKLSTSNGAVTSRGLAGDSTLKTSNGAVTVVGHKGNLNLDTSNGEISVKGVVGAITADTSNGEIDIDADSSESINASSSNGAITVRVPAEFVGTLNCSTSNGKVTNQTKGAAGAGASKTRASISLGTGGASSKISTSNGNVTIIQK